MSEIIKTRALVVYATPWSDTSKIVHLFTREHGYLKVIAKGARRPKSEFRGVLEVLNQVEAVVSLKETRGLQIVTQADLLEAFTNIRDDLNRTAVAFAIMELIRTLLNYRESMVRLYDQTIQLLRELNQPETSEPLLHLLLFLILISEHLGFAWNFAQCARCHRTPQTFPVQVDMENGAVICNRCASLSIPYPRKLGKAQWQLLRQLEEIVRNRTPIPSSLSGISVQRPLVELLLDHLRYHTDQSLQLKSLKMYLP